MFGQVQPSSGSAWSGASSGISFRASSFWHRSHESPEHDQPDKQKFDVHDRVLEEELRPVDTNDVKTANDERVEAERFHIG